MRLAEQTLRDYVGDVVPTWHKEIIDINAPGCHHRGHRGGNKIVVPHRNIREVGSPVYTALATASLGTNYTLYAKYGQIFDTFKIEITGLTDVDTSRLGVYVPSGQRTKDTANLRRWLIPHDTIDFTAGKLTITGKAYLLARPELYEVTQTFDNTVSAFADYSLDPTVMANYLQTLEIGKIEVDQCGNTEIRKNHCGCPSCSPAAVTCDYCTAVCLCIDDAKAGILRPANHYHSCHLPDRYCVSYQAEGLSCNRDWTRDIGILAIAYFCSPICGCSFGCLEQWYADLSNESTKKRVIVENLQNPIGSRVGHLHAWNLIKQFRSGSGLLW